MFLSDFYAKIKVFWILKFYTKFGILYQCELPSLPSATLQDICLVCQHKVNWIFSQVYKLSGFTPRPRYRSSVGRSRYER